MVNITACSSGIFTRSVWLLPGLFLCILFFLLTDPIPQPLSYHNFADQRTVWGINNFGDVITNLAFILII